MMSTTPLLCIVTMLLQSTAATRIRRPLSFCHIKQLSRFHRANRLHLNRILFDTSEIDKSDTSQNAREESDTDEAPMATFTIPKEDYRTIHIAKILGLQNGDSLRAGTVINPSDEERDEFAGLLTDDATITWLPEGKIKKAEPTKNGDPPGSLCISIPQPPKTYLSTQSSDEEVLDNDTPRVSLLLALPRPLQLSRILPMVSQLGVNQLILTNAMKVPKDYFGSHIFRKPEVLRGLLVEGLAQSGDVRLPRVHVTKRLKIFMEDELDELFPPDEVVRVIAHPQRRDIDGKEVGPAPLRMTDIDFPMDGSDKPRQLLVAVGPEGGWTEPYELDMFTSKGFQQITLGTRVLRSDVAVVSLLSLAHEVCSKSK
jgi:16S rRNA (uracil1498-N3)-methyltransferase